MSLSEVEFAFFLPVVLLLYWAAPRRAAVQNAILLGASLVFYATWNLRLLPLFLVGSLIDFALVRGLAGAPPLPDDAPEAERAGRAGRRRTLLAVGLVNNLATLAAFKYATGAALAVNGGLGLLGSEARVGVPHVALPLGLSFYTMARLSVLIDTYYERIEPVRSPLTWFTFVGFFPQLIAGPIGRGSELFEQYQQPRRLTPDAVLRAARELVVGFVLKTYVAAVIAPVYVDPVFAAPGTFTRGAHLMALVGYAAQVYADFAGYSLIAIGVARLFGITLPDNFNHPYLSTQPMEVWRRWHMSLNRWLFDYVYTPMVTGDGVMRGRLGLGLVLVMLVSGIWHGSAWTYLLWGGAHGLWLLFHYRYDLFYKGLCRRDRTWVARRKSTPYVSLAWAATIGFFVLSLIPFRATSIGACLAFGRGLLLGGGETVDEYMMPARLGLLVVVAQHAIHHPRLAPLRQRLESLPAPVHAVALGAAVVLLLLFAPLGSGAFIYAQF